MNLINNILPILSNSARFWPVAFWVPFFLLVSLVGISPRSTRLWQSAARFLPVVSVLTILMFGIYNYRYLTSPIYPGPIQPQISDASWYFVQGHPLYQSPNATEVYSMLYGPNLYIVTGFFEKVLGPGIFASKFAGQIAMFSILLILPLMLWRSFGAKLTTALFCTALFAGVVMVLNPEEILGRGDVFIVLLVVIGCWAANSKSAVAPWVLGAAIGMAVNFKIFAFIHFIPFAWLGWRAGYRTKKIAVTGFVAAGFLLVPFLAFPNISLASYVQYLHWGGQRSAYWPTYFSCIETFLALSMPLFCLIGLAYLRHPEQVMRALQVSRGFVYLIVLEFVLLLYPASRYGANIHYLLPLAIKLFVLFVEYERAGIAWNWQPSLLANGVNAVGLSWLACCLGIGLLRCHQDVALYNGQEVWAQSVLTDLDGVLEKYGSNHVVLMGCSDKDHYDYSFFRPYLVAKGMPIGLDTSAIMDLQLPGAFTPDLASFSANMSHEHGGKKILWLIPNQGTPFSVRSYFANPLDPYDSPSLPAYPDAFRAAFQSTYQRIATTKYYDLYSN
jgi:hypothetical protein